VRYTVRQLLRCDADVTTDALVYSCRTPDSLFGGKWFYRDHSMSPRSTKLYIPSESINWYQLRIGTQLPDLWRVIN
jgi:hypothetical protein